MISVEVRSSGGVGPTFQKERLQSESAVRIMKYLTVMVLCTRPLGDDGVAVVIRRHP